MQTNLRIIFSTILTLFILAVLVSCDKNTNSKIDTGESTTPQSQQEPSQATPLNYAKIKPSTVNLPELKIEKPALPVAKSDDIDWSKVNPKTQVAKDILSALKNGDDLKLGELTRDIGILGLDSFDGGNSYDPTPEETAQFDDFSAIFKAQPAIALELAKYGERIKDQEVTHTWHEKAINYGSVVAVAELEEYGKSSPEAAWPLAVNYQDTNPLKAAEFASLASKSSEENIRQLALENLKGLVWKNGPLVAAAAWKGLVGNTSVNQNEGPNIYAAKCKELGVDFIDPTRSGAFTGTKHKSEVVTYCLSALATSPDNNVFWYNYANAQQAENKFLEAQIGLARAAQLGHPIAIARYWWNDYAYNPERAIKYLTTESKQGNPYGDLFLAQIFDGNSYNKATDLKKAEQLYKQAYEKGIIAASYSLGAFYYKNKDFSSALSWYQKASTSFPEAFVQLGLMYEVGKGVKQDFNQALKFYEKGSLLNADNASYGIFRINERNKKLTLTGKADGNYVAKNTVVCETTDAFLKVDVIERSGNESYVDLPYNCIRVPKSMKANVTGYISTPMGRFAVVKNTQDSILYVRKDDIL
jgi:TPR repeat protein